MPKTTEVKVAAPLSWSDDLFFIEQFFFGFLRRRTGRWNFKVTYTTKPGLRTLEVLDCKPASDSRLCRDAATWLAPAVKTKGSSHDLF